MKISQKAKIFKEIKPKKKNHKKGKLAKKNLKFSERRAKCEKWISSYEGNNIIKAYRKKFSVGRLTAVNELQTLGCVFSKEEIDLEKQAVAAHNQILKNRKQKKKQKKRNEQKFSYPDSDDTFFYIVGYTSGGAPYGVTWEEMGINPYDETDEF